MKKKHINAALFVPHEGCPHQCLFCNQRSISGSVKKLSAEDVKTAAKIAANSGASSQNSEIAFFGGSFTAIKRDYMQELLLAAAKFVEDGVFCGIRISTRPDCIDEEVLEFLKRHYVRAIELGAQSMDDNVLEMNKRGHRAADTINAVKLIKAYGFEIGLQMMTAMYACDGKAAEKTAEKFIELRPDTVRIYPTIVLNNTPLEELYRSGKYIPQSLEEAVKQCSSLMLMFHNANIKLIRVGLHSGGGLDEAYVAGAYHPAFRELCESEIYYNKAREKLDKMNVKGEIILQVNPTERSKMAGQHKSNLERLKKDGYNCRIVCDDAKSKYDIGTIV